MPATPFKSALRKLDRTRRDFITKQLEVWSNEIPPSESAQIAANIAGETALPLNKFVQLLSDFADALSHFADPLIAWDKACGPNCFATVPLGFSDRPVKLGRASKFDRFLQYVKTTDKKFKATFTKFAGNPNPNSFVKNILKAQSLGGAVIFATFDDTDSSQDPFADLPWDRDAIRTVLGLGHHSSLDPYILFRYQSSEPPDLPLHRPTVADAGTISHFRPGSSANAKWGRSLPIPPNSRGLPSKPELVHQKIAGDRLVFPYEVTAT